MNKVKLRCFTSGEVGHFTKDYPERPNCKKKAKNINVVTTSNANGYDNLFIVLSIFSASMLAGPLEKHSWGSDGA
jgi:hypothetical protein